jgi:hypothetical protein
MPAGYGFCVGPVTHIKWGANAPANAYIRRGYRDIAEAIYAAARRAGAIADACRNGRNGLPPAGARLDGRHRTGHHYPGKVRFRGRPRQHYDGHVRDDRHACRLR